MQRRKNKSILWIIVIVVAVVASLTTVAALVLRVKCKKKCFKKSTASNIPEGSACMSFDCSGEEVAEIDPLTSDELES